jgi:hypothetical protein
MAQMRGPSGSAHANNCRDCLRRTHPRSTQLAFAAVDRDRGVCGLVRIDTDDHRREHVRGLK